MRSYNSRLSEDCYHPAEAQGVKNSKGRERGVSQTQGALVLPFPESHVVCQHSTLVSKTVKKCKRAMAWFQLTYKVLGVDEKTAQSRALGNTYLLEIRFTAA